MSLEGALFGIGNPLLDISASVPHSLLEKYELKPANACLAEPKHLPLYEELVKEYQVEYIAGGAAQNTIRAAQWMLQVPGSTSYVGCVGNDKFGEQLRKSAEGDGVAVHYQVDPSAPTGTCAVLVTDKERSLVANLGAASNYKIDHLQSAPIQELINKAKVYYTTGYFLIVSPQSVLSLGKHATEHNKHLVLNISAPFIVDFYFNHLSDAIPYADIVMANESEAQAYGKKQGWGENLAEIAERLSHLPKENTKRKRTVIFTQGADSTIVYDGEKLHTFKPQKIDPKEIVDTNGAGDTFAGGFLAHFLLGHSLEKAIDAGHYCAGLCIRTSGVKFSGKPSFS